MTCIECLGDGIVLCREKECGNGGKRNVHSHVCQLCNGGGSVVVLTLAMKERANLRYGPFGRDDVQH